MRNDNRIHLYPVSITYVYAITIYTLHEGSITWPPDFPLEYHRAFPFLRTQTQTSRHAFYVHICAEKRESRLVSSRQRRKTRFASGRIPCKINSASMWFSANITYRISSVYFIRECESCFSTTIIYWRYVIQAYVIICCKLLWRNAFHSPVSKQNKCYLLKLTFLFNCYEISDKNQNSF